MTNQHSWYYSRKHSGWLWNLYSITDLLFHTNAILLLSIVDLTSDRAAAIYYNANHNEVFILIMYIEPVLCALASRFASGYFVKQRSV